MAAAKKAPSRTRRAGSKSSGKTTSKKVASTRSTAQKRKPQKKLRPAKKDTLRSNDIPRLPHSVSLSSLNPFRLPIHPDQIAIATARYGGVFFVLVGGLLAFYHLQFLSASLADNSVPSFLAATLTSETNTTSDVIFDVPYGSSVSGELSIVMTVDGETPERIQVGLHHKDSGNSYELGDAKAQNDGSWLLPWDTTQYPDGEYQLIAFVTDAYGSYEDKSDGYVLVDNSSTDELNTTPDADFLIGADEPLAGSVPVSILVENAHSVRLEVIDTETHETYSVGDATEVLTGTWELDLVTTDLPDGTYKLRAIIKNEYGEYDDFSDTTHLVENEPDGTSLDTSSDDTSTDDTVSDDTSLTETTAPDLSIDPLGDEPLSGEVVVNINAADVSEVRLEMYDTGREKHYTLGDAAYAGNDEWQVYLDTTDYSNGIYELTASVKLDDGTVITDTVRAEIDNALTDETISVDTADETTLQETLDPEIRIDIRGEQPLQGVADIRIRTEAAEFIELFAVRRYSRIEQFLGLARKVENAEWRFRFDSTNLPNGAYHLFARAKHPYGLSDSEPVRIEVFNALEASAPDGGSGVSADSDASLEAQEDDSSGTDVPTLGEQFDSDPESREERIKQRTGAILDAHHEAIEAARKRYAEAVRNGDGETERDIKSMLDELYERIREQLRDENDELGEAVSVRIREHFDQLLERTKRIEKLLSGRERDAALADSDGDGITDHDERTIYGTDPESSDTDADGYTDGAEVSGGFDPLDPRPEVLIQYESPKEAGIVRDDILAVTELETASKTASDRKETGTNAEAYLTGTALPNSYVTIYIFSTPIIVTVRADEEGNWQYRFDKELEDGEHEVYVGITDNAGRVIAKSEPFRFVKEAQAFTPVGAAAPDAPTRLPEANTFATQNIIIVILSLSVVGIGVTLILIGMHLRGRREPERAEADTETYPVV